MCKAVQDILNTKDPIAPPRPVPSSNLSRYGKAYELKTALFLQPVRILNRALWVPFNLLEYSTEPFGHPTQSRNNATSVSQKATLVN